ncbi:MAG: hypothetical protein HZA93_08415 [Verrucomicrobia bacterium]|nr:hypothetical protein [Verrucomicrobiota bacterium]
MNSDPLDELLSAYAKQPLPSAPDRFTADVWKDIEHRRHRRLGTLLGLNWRELLERPRLALSALGLALLAGLVPAIMARSADHALLARDSLHFEVFSPDTPLVLVATAHSVRK